MKRVEYNNLKQISASDNMYLTQKKDVHISNRIIVKTLYLSNIDFEDNYIEISKEEKDKYNIEKNKYNESVIIDKNKRKRR